MMRPEERLASRLLTLFTAYKQRAAANMIQFYEDRLSGLEDALLDTRFKLLDLQVACSATFSPAIDVNLQEIA